MLKNTYYRLLRDHNKNHSDENYVFTKIYQSFLTSIDKEKELFSVYISHILIFL